MRGLDERADSLFSYVDLQDRVSAKLPLRVIGRIVNDVLAERTRQDLRRQRPSLDSAGAPAASAAAAGVLERGGPLQAARLVLRQEGALRALSLLRGYAHKPALAKFEGDEAMLTADQSQAAAASLLRQWRQHPSW